MLLPWTYIQAIRKAFDTVNHAKLFIALSKTGIYKTLNVAGELVQ